MITDIVDADQPRTTDRAFFELDRRGRDARLLLTWFGDREAQSEGLRGVYGLVVQGVFGRHRGRAGFSEPCDFERLGVTRDDSRSTLVMKERRRRIGVGLWERAESAADGLLRKQSQRRSRVPPPKVPLRAHERA